jgi:hypothetical protein
MGIVFDFFLSKFLEGAFYGGLIRIIIAIIFRGDFTLKGLIMSAIVGGLLVVGMYYWLLHSI